MSSGIIEPTQDEIVHLMNRTITNILEEEDTSVLDTL